MKNTYLVEKETAISSPTRFSLEISAGRLKRLRKRRQNVEKTRSQQFFAVSRLLLNVTYISN